MAQEFWNQKSFVLVTGASRGLGRNIAIEFSKKVAPGSVFLLVARTADALEETKALVLQSSPSVEVVLSAVDLAKPDGAAYLNLITSTLTAKNKRQASDFDHAILVHNAASLGNMSLHVSQFDDLDEIQSYFNLNLFSLLLLTTQFLKVFKNLEKQRTLVQISSSWALTPVKTMGYYCTGKAARDMVMKNIGVEEPSVQTMSYAPGAFESEMYDDVSKNAGDDEVRQLLKGTRENGIIITAEQSAKKLVKILGEKKHTKGEHVDYYDLEFPDE